MWEIDVTLDSIGAYLEQVRLLKAQPQVDEVLIDDILWKVLGLAIKLDDMYEQKYREELEELENTETITLRDELLKRERILELSRIRESVLEDLFDQNIHEEKLLYDLFEDIRKEHSYESLFHESDLNLVKEQLNTIEENRIKEQLLKEEYENNITQINDIQNKIMTFEEFNVRLDEEYKNFIEANEIDKIDARSAEFDKLAALERQSIIKENMKLLETAQNIDVSQFKYLGDRYANDRIIIEESNELLFMVELANKMRLKVNNYEELQKKVESIVNLVSTRETELLSKFPNMNYPNELSYRTIYFMNDLKSLNEQLNSSYNIRKLKTRNKAIEEELENLYDNVKGRRELDDIINNRVQPIEPQEEITEPVKDELQEEMAEPVKDELQEEVSEPVKDEPQEEINEIIKDEPIIDGEILEVTKTEKASSKLLAKIKNIKNRLLTLAHRAAPFILSGAILLAPLVMNGDQKRPIVNDVPAIESVVDDAIAINPSIIDNVDKNIPSLDELTQTIEDLEEKVTSNSIGDKVNIESGVKYYRDATSAQLDNNSYEAGRGTSGLRPENYNVNRIAIMEKDMLGNPTGKILAVTTTPGVSAEELATSLGLEVDQYEVMIHIGAGDENGNYIEASRNSASVDDLCWMRADSPGVKIVTPASEILNTSGKGIVR